MKSSCGIGSWDLARAVVAHEIAVCPDRVAKPHVVGAFIIQLLTFRLLWSAKREHAQTRSLPWSRPTMPLSSDSKRSRLTNSRCRGEFERDFSFVAGATC